MNIEIKKIRHKDINEKDLENIIRLKQQHWPFSKELQIQWMEKNLQNDDVHLFLTYDNQIVAYMNIVNLIVSIDEIDYKFYGAGNVCVDKAHLKKGWGKCLLEFFSCDIKENNHKAILLCRDNLISYYMKNGWSLIDGNVQKFIEQKESTNNFMINNCDIDIIKMIAVNRNF